MKKLIVLLLLAGCGPEVPCEWTTRCERVGDQNLCAVVCVEVVS